MQPSGSLCVSSCPVMPEAGGLDNTMPWILPVVCIA